VREVRREVFLSLVMKSGHHGVLGRRDCLGCGRIKHP